MEYSIAMTATTADSSSFIGAKTSNTISLRSKGKVDVAKFAEQFGGGGHARAAGLKMDGYTVDAAHEVVVQRMLQMLQ